MLMLMAPGWLDRVSKLPPEVQVTELTAEMKRRNPEWDGVVTPTIADGQVVGIAFDSLHMKDLSPIVAFTNLKELEANSSLTNSDLSPLVLLKSLTAVDVAECERIVDLTPLQSLPLVDFIISRSSVSDLSPIADKPFQMFNARYCSALTGLSPLRGAPFQSYLGLEHSGVTDLTPKRESSVGLRIKAILSAESPEQGFEHVTAEDRIELLASLAETKPGLID